MRSISAPLDTWARGTLRRLRIRLDLWSRGRNPGPEDVERQILEEYSGLLDVLASTRDTVTDLEAMLRGWAAPGQGPARTLATLMGRSPALTQDIHAARRHITSLMTHAARHYENALTRHLRSMGIPVRDLSSTQKANLFEARVREGSQPLFYNAMMNCLRQCRELNSCLVTDPVVARRGAGRPGRFVAWLLRATGLRRPARSC